VKADEAKLRTRLALAKQKLEPILKLIGAAADEGKSSITIYPGATHLFDGWEWALGQMGYKVLNKRDSDNRLRMEFHTVSWGDT
jgi:hypothetical protein